MPPPSTSNSRSGVRREALAVRRPAPLPDGDRPVAMQPGGPAESGNAVLEDARPQRKQLHELPADLVDRRRRGPARGHRPGRAVDAIQVTGPPAGQGAYLTAGRGDRWRQALAAAFAMPHLAIPAPAARTGRISFAIGLVASDVPCCPRSAAARIRAKRPLAEQGKVV